MVSTFWSVVGKTPVAGMKAIRKTTTFPRDHKDPNDPKFLQIGDCMGVAMEQEMGTLWSTRVTAKAKCMTIGDLISYKAKEVKLGKYKVCMNEWKNEGRIVQL